ASGPPAKIAQIPQSLTGQYLSGHLRIPVPETRRSPNGKGLRILGARANNLKNIDVEIPLRVLTVVTGVSGSGKSTLINDILHRALAKETYRAVEERGADRAESGTTTPDQGDAIG